MITTLITIVVLVFICLTVGWGSGQREYTMLVQQTPFGKDLDHGPLWLWRLRYIAPSIAIAFVAINWTTLRDPSWLMLVDAIALSGMAWGSCAPMHRRTLNHERRFNEFYVAPGNGYDRVFLHLTGMKVDEAYHKQHYNRDLGYGDQVHRAGRLAYRVEFIALALSIAGLITKHLLT